jgi:hypothetical protein
MFTYRRSIYMRCAYVGGDDFRYKFHDITLTNKKKQYNRK